LKHPRQIIYEIDSTFEDLWQKSGVSEAYLVWVDERIDEIVRNLHAYDPDEMSISEYKSSIQVLAYTTTELIAQFCAGGFRWSSSDKARYLSPTVDLEKIIRKRAFDNNDSVGEYFEPVSLGVWDFLEISELTKSWIEASSLNVQQTSYLLWSSNKALELLHADERIPGFTRLVLSDSLILDGYRKCSSPVESILYMQFIVDGLRPPVLQNQWTVGAYQVDFAIPKANLAIECDIEKNSSQLSDKKKDKILESIGWSTLHFPTKKILQDPSACSNIVYDTYRWGT
jgi:very-short-patch-repair endonuclease